jgi:hypothetical protein
MRHYIIARSRDGWAVAHEADVLKTFVGREEARSFAEELCVEAFARQEQAAVVDLTEDEGP